MIIISSTSIVILYHIHLFPINLIICIYINVCSGSVVCYDDDDNDIIIMVYHDDNDDNDDNGVSNIYVCSSSLYDLSA